MNRIFVCLCIFSVLVLTSSCSGVKTHNFDNAPEIEGRAVESDTESINDLIKEELQSQYSSFDSLMEHKNSEYVGQNMMKITWERPVLSMLNHVTSYQYGDDYLISGFDNGDVRIWGDYNCPYLSIREKNEKIESVSWDGKSEYIGVIQDDENVLNIYSLKMCGIVEEIQSEGPISQAAISPNGKNVCIIDEGRRIIVFKDDDNDKISTLRYKPLAVSYTPKGGMLMILDKAGWIIFWSVPDYEVVDKFKIPGGPFSSAKINGSRISLKPDDRKNEFQRVVWDIKNKKVVSNKDEGFFSLKGDTLLYKHPSERPNLKTFFKKPNFRVLVSDNSNLVMVRDLHGENKFYDLETGDILKNIKDALSDSIKWKFVDVNEYGTFLHNGTQYNLADTVYTKNNDSLMCRYVKGQGYYFWWTKSDGRDAKIFDNKLPVRINILKNAESIEWKPI